MDLETTRKALVAAVEAKKAEEPLLRAILLESTILPYFADTLRQARKVPVFDTITLADYICMSRTDNPRFGAAFGKEDAFHRWQGLDKAAMPAIGILRIDYDYPPAPGDIDRTPRAAAASALCAQASRAPCAQAHEPRLRPRQGSRRLRGAPASPPPAISSARKLGSRRPSSWRARAPPS